MAKKGQTFSSYPSELKAEAVRLHEEEHLSYRTIARILGVKNKTQIVKWIARARCNQSFDDLRGSSTAWRKGRPKTKFSSIEEELAYVKAERDYLKKRYPNLHGEVCQREQDSK